VCGCDVGTNGVVRISEDCSCNPCTIRGRYGYEGYGEEFEFNYYPEEDGEEEPADPEEPVEPPEEPKPSVSVWFDKSAVIFEDEYENSPGETVPRRSTRTTLKCTAYGGERGGNLTVDLSGMGELKLVSGTSPSSRTIVPYETVTFEAEYEAEKASSQKDGTVARAKITENETNQVFDDDDKITVVEVRKNAVATVPPFRQRKEVGVGERADISLTPNNVASSMTVESGRVNKDGMNGFVYLAPRKACVDRLVVDVNNVEFDVCFSVLQPSGFAVKSIKGFNSGLHDKAGNYSALIDYIPLPTNVSFYALEFMEIGMKATDATGYFAKPEYDSLLDHSLWGDGEWFAMESYSDYFVDEIAINMELPQPWNNGGSFTWPIPVVWRFYQEEGVTNPLVNQDQRFEIDANGTSRIRKLGCTVEQCTNMSFRAVIGL
jgi:hypothetical protein